MMNDEFSETDTTEDEFDAMRSQSRVPEGLPWLAPRPGEYTVKTTEIGGLADPHSRRATTLRSTDGELAAAAS